MNIMCLSKPQKVVEFSGGFATVRFQGRLRKVRSAIGLKKGDYVLCQAGVVAQKIPAGRARQMLKEWKELNRWK